MARLLSRCLVTSLLLPVLACSAGPSAALGPGAPAAALAASGRALPLKRFSASRHVQQGKDGYYYLPAGLCDDYPEESTTLAKIRKDLETMQQVGAKHLRFAFGWDSIEETPGTYNWLFWDKLVEMAPRYGVTLIPYVCYTPKWQGTSETDYWHQPPKDPERFGKFMEVIARRYKGKISSWELWNEPDIQAYWQGPVDKFGPLIVAGAQGVRRGNPEAVIVLGGMANGRSPFIETLMTRYQLGRYVDVLNLHGYLETWGEDRAETYPNRVGAMADLIRRTAPGLDLWMAEFGYSDYRFSPSQVSQWGISVVYDYEHTPAYQAVALFKHHVLALASQQLSLMAWYRINDLAPKEGVIGDDNNKFLGILDPNGRPKPAFHALKLYNQLFNQPSRPVDDRVQIVRPANSQAVVQVFERQDGHLLVTGWLRSSTRGEVADTSGKAKDTRRETVRITLPAGYTQAAVHDVLKPGQVQRRHLSEPVLTDVTLTGDQVFVADVSR